MRILPIFLSLPLLAQGPPLAPAKPGVLQVPAEPRASSNPIKELVRADLSEAEAGTPEALAASLYAFVSGPKDEKRNLEKIRALFHPQARIMVAARHPEKGFFLRPMELEAFLSYAAPQWERTGFYEQSTAVSVQKLDGLAQVWTPYEIRLAADGPALYTGVNALQCAWNGKRWWITHLEFQNAPTAALLAESAEPKK